MRLRRLSEQGLKGFTQSNYRELRTPPHRHRPSHCGYCQSRFPRRDAPPYLDYSQVA
jgi:hypothetical protein